MMDSEVNELFQQWSRLRKISDCPWSVFVDMTPEERERMIEILGA